MKRRKVVSAYKIHWSGNMFECTLECGHMELADGRRTKASWQQTPPKTCACRRCSGIKVPSDIQQEDSDE